MPDTKTETKSREAEMAERFARDTANHELTVVHDDGVYRHIKARSTKAGEGWFCWFEVVTWPGALAIRGDCGSFQFARLDDMFEFFRLDGREINPSYWAEKTPDGGRSLKKYSEDALRERLDDWLTDYERDYLIDFPEYADYKARVTAWEALPKPNLQPMPDPMAEPPALPTPALLRTEIAEHEEEQGLYDVESARELLDHLEKRGVVDGTWEWDLTDWDWQYLWCCYAIVWAIAKYDDAVAPGYRRHLEPSIDGGWLSMPALGSARARVQVGTLTGRHDEGMTLTAATPTKSVEVQLSFKTAADLTEQIQQLSRFHMPSKGGESK